MSKNPEKNPYQPMDFKNLKKKILEPKASKLLPKNCDFQNENHTLGYDLKIYRKSIAYPLLFKLWDFHLRTLPLEPTEDNLQRSEADFAAIPLRI